MNMGRIAYRGRLKLGPGGVEADNPGIPPVRAQATEDRITGCARHTRQIVR